MRRTVFLGLSAFAPWAMADQAVVIGISKYANPGPRVLWGAENDARSMADYALKKGFKLPPNHLLLGSNATKEAIVRALDDLKHAGKDEKVLVFFAGQGTHFGRAKSTRAILPYDFVDGKPSTTISMPDFTNRLSTIPTRTVPFWNYDCDFDGATSRAADGFDVRGYAPHRSRDATPRPTDDDPTDLGLPSGSRVCVVSSSRPSEHALETEIDGKPHGLFTYGLLQALESGKEMTAEELCVSIRTSIAKLLEERHSSRQQTPDVTSAYRNVVVVGGARGADSFREPKPPQAVWDLLAQERPDPAKLRLIVKPDRSDLLLGQVRRIGVRVGGRGYLVVVWSKETVSLQRPPVDVRGRFEVAEVDSGEYPVFDHDEVFTQPGGNRVTAFLFASKARAQQLVDALTGVSHRIEDLQSEGLLSLEKDSDVYTTASVSFEVGEGLPGGLRIADAPKLLDALLKNPYHDRFVNGAGIQGGSILDDLRGKSVVSKPSPVFVRLLTLLLNAAIEQASNDGQPFVDPEDDELTPLQKVEVGQMAERIRQADPLERAALNAQLLAKLLPNLIVPDAP